MPEQKLIWRNKDENIHWSPPKKWVIEEVSEETGAGLLIRTELNRAITELGLNAPSRLEHDDTVTVVVSNIANLNNALDKIYYVFGTENIEYLEDSLIGSESTVKGIACCTESHLKSVIDRGTLIPAANIGLGVDHWERVITESGYRAPGKRYRFLHVSPCDYECGIDLLLETFGRVFDSSDQVSLLIRPLSKQLDVLYQHLDRLRKIDPDYPHVVIICDDLTEAELKALYRSCHVFLAPTRSRDFGMPIAQALLSGLPVVTTAWGGQVDYCDEQSCYMVDYDYKPNVTAHGAVTLAGIEPIPRLLDAAVWSAYCLQPHERFSKAWCGRQRLLESFTWKAVALRLAEFARKFDVKKSSQALPSRLGLVTTWNVKCGIGSYTEHLIGKYPTAKFVVFAGRQEPLTRPDESNVLRSWNVGKISNDFKSIETALLHQPVDSILIQFNFGFFNHFELRSFIENVAGMGIAVFIDLHSTTDTYGNVENYRLQDFLSALKICKRILVHNLSDLRRLKVLGLVDNVILFPLGVINDSLQSYNRTTSDKVPLITSFGFCFDTKGLLELVHAVDILRNSGYELRLRMLNAEYHTEHSIELVKKIKKTIDELDLEEIIEFCSDYLPDDVCLSLLREADLFVNPYQRTNESASAAVRFGLAAGVPVAVTPLPFFDDLGDAVFRMPGITPESIAEGIRAGLSDLSNNSETAVRVRSAARLWLADHDYSLLGARLIRLIKSLT